MTSKAERVVTAVLGELRGRHGIGIVLAAMDEDVDREMRKTLVEIVDVMLASSQPRPTTPKREPPVVGECYAMPVIEAAEIVRAQAIGGVMLEQDFAPVLRWLEWRVEEGWVRSVLPSTEAYDSAVRVLARAAISAYRASVGGAKDTPQTSAQTPASTATKRWDYYVERYFEHMEDGDVEGAMEELGSGGWELVSIAHKGRSRVAYFKRPIGS